MAKAKKQKNGSWRVQVYDYTDASGKKHYKSITDSTKAGAEFRAAEFAKEKRTRTRNSGENWTVKEAIDKYIELKKKISPTTIDAYKKIRKYAFQDIMNMKVAKIDDIVMQSAINREAERKGAKTGKTISAKTVKNEWGLLEAALSLVCHKTFTVSLPEYQQHIRIMPEPAQILAALKGTDIELPCLLAMWLSFSMSEVRGLHCSDIQGDYLIINRVTVDTSSGPVTKDNAKVDTRLRLHKIPPYLMELINNTQTYKNYRQSGENRPLIDASRDRIYGRWQTVCKQNHLPAMSFHDLRHMSASVLLALNVPEKYAMERGGWKTPNIMKSVYQHTLSAERQAVDARIDDYFGRLMEEISQ